MNIKIIFKVIDNMFWHFIIGTLMAAVFYFIFELLWLSVLIFIVVFGYYRLWLELPIGLGIKRKLDEYNDKGVMIDSGVNPYSKEFELLKFEHEWLGKGASRIVMWIPTLVFTNYNKKGIFIHFKEYPTFNLYFISWLDIKSITKDPSLIKDFIHIFIDDYCLLEIGEQDKVGIPLADSAVEMWEGINSIGTATD